MDKGHPPYEHLYRTTSRRLPACLLGAPRRTLLPGSALLSPAPQGHHPAARRRDLASRRTSTSVSSPGAGDLADPSTAATSRSRPYPLFAAPIGPTCRRSPSWTGGPTRPGTRPRTNRGADGQALPGNAQLPRTGPYGARTAPGLPIPPDGNPAPLPGSRARVGGVATGRPALSRLRSLDRAIDRGAISAGELSRYLCRDGPTPRPSGADQSRCAHAPRLQPDQSRGPAVQLRKTPTGPNGPGDQRPDRRVPDQAVFKIGPARTGPDARSADRRSPSVRPDRRLSGQRCATPPSGPARRRAIPSNPLPVRAPLADAAACRSPTGLRAGKQTRAPDGL